MSRKLALIVAGIILFSGLLIWENSLEKSSAIGLKNLQVDYERLEMENKKLCIEKDKCCAFETLTKVAKEKKLVPPEQDKVIFIE